MEKEEEKPNNSYIIPLIKAFDVSQGDVLEVGTGDPSSLLLNWLASIYRRNVYLYEDNQHSYEQNKRKENEYRHVVLSKNLKEENFDNRNWGMAFINSFRTEEYYDILDKLKNKAVLIEIYGTNINKSKVNQYNNLLDSFKYRYDYKKNGPWTTVLSNFKKFNE